MSDIWQLTIKHSLYSDSLGSLCLTDKRYFMKCLLSPPKGDITKEKIIIIPWTHHNGYRDRLMLVCLYLILNIACAEGGLLIKSITV